MELKKMIENYTNYITDESENKWEVIEVSDLDDLMEAYHQAKLKLLGIGGVGVRSKQLPCKNEYAKEVIEDALYKTGRFSTDDCTEIMEGLMMYINDASLHFTEQGN